MKKLAILKKKMAKELIIIVPIVVGLGILAGLSFYLKQSTQEELDQLSQESMTLNGQSRTLQSDYDNYLKSNDEYNKIPENRRTSDDLNTTAARIRAARPIIEELKQRYMFEVLDVTFSPIEEDPVKYETRAVSVLRNEISVGFSGLSDEMVLSFIDSVIKEFPGYIEVKDIRIEKKGDINQELFDKISKERKIPSLVSGSITFYWRTIKGPAKQPDDKNINL